MGGRLKEKWRKKIRLQSNRKEEKKTRWKEKERCVCVCVFNQGIRETLEGSCWYAVS